MGCTHYSLIKKEIHNILPNALLLDGCLGVSLEVKRQLENNNLINNSNNKGNIKIINNKSDDLIKRSFEILNSDL